MQAIANNQAAARTLDSLAAEAQLYSCGAAMNLLQLGRVLNEAKPLVPHGSWIEWVAINAHMPVRTAQTYMQAWRKFGDSQEIANLGTSAIIKLLPMTDEERETLLREYDVPNMSARQLAAATKEVRAQARAEADAELREHYEELLRQAEDDAAKALSERDRAIREAEEAKAKGGKIPPQAQAAIDRAQEEAREAQESAQHFAELVKRITGEKADAERQLKDLRAEADETADLLREQQEELNRAQAELLEIKSLQARGDAQRPDAEDLTVDVFSAAVREFIGLVARMPYMQTAFAGMDTARKNAYAELLRTVEGWADASRRALSAVAVEGGVVHG